MSVKSIPDGYHTVTPYLVVNDANKLIDFLEKAFNATGTECVKDKEGRTMHAEVKIGDSMVMLGQATGESKPNEAMLYIYVEDADAVYQQALKAGGVSLMEPRDQFYGDRNAGIQGPCGNRWWIATHVEDVTSEELEVRSQNYHENH